MCGGPTPPPPHTHNDGLEDSGRWDPLMCLMGENVAFFAKFCNVCALGKMLMTIAP